MMKRTLWYACLVLLCCSAGVLVLATSAGKTTLLPDSATSGKATPAHAKLLTSNEGSQEAVAKQETAPVRSEVAQAPLLTEINPAYTEQAPIDKDGAVEMTADVARDGKAAPEKAVGKSSAEAEKIGAEPAENQPATDAMDRMTAELRKSREITARKAGHDARYVADLSDADLIDLISGSKPEDRAGEAVTPKADEKPLDKPLPEKATEVKSSETSDMPVEFSPVALDSKEEDRPTAGAASTLDEGSVGSISGTESSNPVIKTADVAANEAVAEPAGTTVEPVIPMVFEPIEAAQVDVTPVVSYASEEAEETPVDPETALRQAFEADQAGQPLTRRQKMLIEQYDAAHPRTGGRNTEHLDDNGGTTFVYTGDSLKIPPSGSGGASSDTTLCSITVSGLPTALTDVEVEIDSLMHTYDGDLHIYLQGPTGLRVLLSNDNGSSSENYLHTRFSDAATTLITAGSAPFTGTYKPEEALSAYDGTDPNGIWTLRISDDSGGDSGAVFSWRIQVKTPNTTAADNFATTAISSPNTEPYNASASVAVTATFINYGTTTQTCPVKYSFNGGATVEETSASLVQYATDVHSFATNITLPADTGNYILTVWTDHAADADRTDDTLRVTVRVFSGGACQSAITINAVAGTPDSASYNNCGAGSNNPGQPCGTAGSNAGSDMVFKMDVADGQQGEIWQSSNAFDSRHSLRWNGACPGTNVIDCQDTPDEKKLRFVNHTGSTQTIYFTVSYYGSALTCGAFKLAWHLQNTSDATLPYANGFETTPPSTGYAHVLPDFWSIENSNNDMYPWVNATTSPFSGGYCAYKSSSTVAGNDDWLFTPGLPLTAGVSYGLQFYRKSYSTTYPESLEVKIGTQNLSSAMTQSVMAWDSFKTNVWTKKNANFSVSSTGTYYIGFHSYTRTSSGGCYLDSVRVEQNPDYDFANIQILGPIGGPYNQSASLPVAGRIQNVGQNADLTPVSYTFNGGAVVTENTASLNPMAYEDHTFGTNLTTPASNGTYVLTMYSDYA
ncbi:hypothetical protein EHM69_11850, partial [candidate division KSB1 bacterium]